MKEGWKRVEEPGDLGPFKVGTLGIVRSTGLTLEGS